MMSEKECEHCGENLSYSAYLQHRRLCYLTVEKRWIRQSDALPPESKCTKTDAQSADMTEKRESQFHAMGGNVIAR